MCESGWRRDERRAAPQVQAVAAWQLCAKRAKRTRRPVKQEARWSARLAASNSIRTEGARLRLGEFAFPRNALMQFVGALDPIFVLAIAWKVLDHLIDAHLAQTD